MFIVGDSMVKRVRGWDFSKKMKSNCKVYVKHFSGAETDYMINYSKPILRDDHDHFILHAGKMTSNQRIHQINY